MSNGTDDRSSSQRAHDAIQLYYRMAPVTVPFFAILLALAVAAVIILLTGSNPLDAYYQLFDGMFGDKEAIANSIAKSTPFMGAALAVAFAFKAGLFNIGAEGQILIGALGAAWVGTWEFLQGWPGVFAIPIVLLGGVAGGAIWGGIPGVLKARTGAHEVIVTIMLNAIAIRLALWLVNSRDPVILLDEDSSVPRTKEISEHARLPNVLDDTTLSLAILVAIILVAIVAFVLNRTTFGFEVGSVGLNPNAAKYSGMRVNRTIVLVMAGAGAIAGVAGAAEISGVEHSLSPGVFAAIGFDAIAIALLARTNPWAIIPASLLWGSLLSGAPQMQLEAGISIDIVRIILALILLFVAADAIVRWVFHIRSAAGATKLTERQFGSGWGTAP